MSEDKLELSSAKLTVEVDLVSNIDKHPYGVRYGIFVNKSQMHLGYAEICAMCKVNKAYFVGHHGFLCRILGLE